MLILTCLACLLILSVSDCMLQRLVVSDCMLQWLVDGRVRSFAKLRSSN